MENLEVDRILVRGNVLFRAWHRLCDSLAWGAWQACSSPVSEGSWLPGAWRGSGDASPSVASPATPSNTLTTLSLWGTRDLEEEEKWWLHIYYTASRLQEVKQSNLKAHAEFTWWANQSEAAQVGGVMSSIHPRNVSTHGCPNQVERPLVQADALNKLQTLKHKPELKSSPSVSRWCETGFVWRWVQTWWTLRTRPGML